MITLSKILLYMGLVMLLVALVRLGSAQPAPEDIGIEQRGISELRIDTGPAVDMGMQRAGAPPTGVPTGVPVGMLISEHGVALKDNKTYALRIIVECLMPVEPRRVQKLLASNKSLEEIRDTIGSEQGEAVYRGNMKLDEIIYPLMNIRIAPFSDNISILEADVSKPNQDPALINEIEVVGHIQMTIEPSEGGNTGKGEIQMNDSHHFGMHAIIIDILTPCEKSMAWRWDSEDMREGDMHEEDMHEEDIPEAPRYPLRPSSDKED